MQYDRDAKGKLAPLPAPCVDTGMGLERVTAVIQGKFSNYDTDLFLPLIETAARARGKTYGEDEASDVSLRVIADHRAPRPSSWPTGSSPATRGAAMCCARS